MREPRSVVEAYFSCMRAGDLAVLELFHPDAELLGLGMHRRGRDEIAAFYGPIIASARPQPSPAGPLLCQGNRVMAQVDIRVGSDLVVHAIDVFVVEEGEIRSLTYFTADIPPD